LLHIDSLNTVLLFVTAHVALLCLLPLCVLNDVTDAISKIHRFKAMGVRLPLDDFVPAMLPCLLKAVAAGSNQN